MAKGKSTKSKVKNALWMGFGFGLGSAIFVPLINYVVNTVRSAAKV